MIRPRKTKEKRKGTEDEKENKKRAKKRGIHGTKKMRNLPVRTSYIQRDTQF